MKLGPDFPSKIMLLSTCEIPQALLNSWPPREEDKALTNKEGVQLRIEVMGFPEFVKQCRDVVTAAGAVATDRLAREHGWRTIDAILSDKDLNHEMRVKANENFIPVFTKTWLMECLYRRSFLFPDEQPGIYTYNDHLPRHMYFVLEHFFESGVHTCPNEKCPCRKKKNIQQIRKRKHKKSEQDQEPTRKRTKTEIDPPPVVSKKRKSFRS
eukprot:TRINITY_DN9359_c0_g2_i2.p1 TRINITY_DN9359_c0_g2~~TRINITY_DN9359_c0_g2_i2.p1  ORF type:complete len:211 (-),score=38.93 TRINITY_DN9359_c0_g2_i2:201-833(-)